MLVISVFAYVSTTVTITKTIITISWYNKADLGDNISTVIITKTTNTIKIFWISNKNQWITNKIGT